jgi:catechol 2,3-dioxygenase-like lactoylglutathione lyase family enzyme
MSKVVPLMRVFDRAKTIEFYVDWLGFNIDWEYKPIENAPFYMRVSLRDIVFELTEHHGECSPGASVAIEDFEGLEAYHLQLLDKNYRYGKPGLKRPDWPENTLVLTVYDPFSNKIHFNEKIR